MMDTCVVARRDTMAQISGADDYKLELSTEEKPERVPYTASTKETIYFRVFIREASASVLNALQITLLLNQVTTVIEFRKSWLFIN